jgi:PAP_fibrillin
MNLIYSFAWLLLISNADAFIFDGARKELKAELLKLSKETKRGIDASPDQEKRIKTAFERLEKLNPTRNPLKSPLVNGDWSLEYTTAGYLVGKGDFPRVGPIVQKIDTLSLTAENSEVVNYFGFLQVPRKVTAELSPQSNQLTNVQFKRFSLGPIGFDAPESAKGSLDITYLDNDLRLSRGDKGNLFVLTRM